MTLGLFYHPIILPFNSQLWLLLPLLLGVAIVYKTIRTEHLRRLPLQILSLMAYMLVGLTALGFVLWAIQKHMV